VGTGICPYKPQTELRWLKKTSLLLFLLILLFNVELWPKASTPKQNHDISRVPVLLSGSPDDIVF
jgi:hypothetical protein